MLTREVMGILALAILWVSTLLIAAAAAKDLWGLLDLRRRLRPRDPAATGVGYGMIQGRVARGDGPGGALACRKVEQVGRSAGDPQGRRAIHFNDRSTSGDVSGGAVVLEAAGNPAPEEVEIAPYPSADVWIATPEVSAAAPCPPAEQFDPAYDAARKARGFARTIEAPVAAGRLVWVAGDIHRAKAGGALRVTPSREHGLIVSTLDPRAFCARKIALSAAAIAFILAAAATCTALALQEPYFGRISTAGGALGLLFFLLVQPLGTTLRDAVLLPHRAPVRGQWTREGAAPAGTSSSRPTAAASRASRASRA